MDRQPAHSLLWIHSVLDIRGLPGKGIGALLRVRGRVSWGKGHRGWALRDV